MAFDLIRPALRPMVGSLTFGCVCLSWMGAVLGSMLLVPQNWVIGVVVAAGAGLILLVPAWSLRRQLFAILAGSLVVFLLAAEAVIRLVYFGPDALRHPTQYQPIGAIADPDYLAPAPEPDVVYTQGPGFKGWVKGALVEVNRVGARDRDWLLERGPEMVRIMTLGTSITMGEGVAADATFTSLLGQRLTVPGSAIETMNFGVGGYGLGTSQALLRARGLQFTPDIVVQELGVAMLGETPETTHQLRTSFERTRKSPPTASFFETNSFAVFAIYPSVSLRARIAGLMSPPADTRPTAGDYVEEVLGRFGQLAGERKFLGVVFVPRPILAFDDRTLHERERETIRRDAVANKLVYIDSYDRFSPLDQVEALSIFPSELHPNAEAHRRHADALVEALTPLLAQR